MLRSLALAYWEIRRIRRSRLAAAVVLAVPSALAVAYLMLPGRRTGTTFKCILPAATLLAAWTLLYIRSFSDRLSGFAAGLGSTPAAGVVLFAARFLTGVILASIQAAIFYAIVCAVG